MPSMTRLGEGGGQGDEDRDERRARMRATRAPKTGQTEIVEAGSGIPPASERRPRRAPVVEDAPPASGEAPVLGLPPDLYDAQQGEPPEEAAPSPTAALSTTDAHERPPRGGRFAILDRYEQQGVVVDRLDQQVDQLRATLKAIVETRAVEREKLADICAEMRSDPAKLLRGTGVSWQKRPPKAEKAEE